MTKRLRVGISAKAFIDWGGGVDFLTYLVNALALNPELKVYLLVPDEHGSPEIRVTKDQAHRTNPLSTRLISHLSLPLKAGTKKAVQQLKVNLSKKVAIRFYRSTPQAFMARLKDLRLDVVGPTTLSFGPDFPLPWLGYIWDFQHKYFSEFFDNNERTERDKIFRHTLTEAPVIIVNSRQIKKDVRRFFPSFKRLNKIVSLPFAPSLLKSWISSEPGRLKHYNLPARYIMVCNQFWVHKGHSTLFEAMAILHKKAPFKDVVLVCTGKMEEPRRPEYINSLKTFITKNNLKDTIRLLGFLPKQDQLAIMRSAQAVIQPTLYEGGPGGGAAYNAIAFGVPLIASDIPINQELQIGEVSFFKAGSANALSTQIKRVLSQPTKLPSVSKLIEQSRHNQQQLCQVLTDAIKQAIRNYESS